MSREQVITASKTSRVSAEERRRLILATLGERGRVTVEEVARQFGVSAVTARGDLDALETAGSLVRSHGGGIKPLTAAPEHPLVLREVMHQAEKQAIARCAANLIKPRQTVLLCTGSTSAYLADELARNCPPNVTAITYALNIAMRLMDQPNISLLMLGGFLRRTSTAFVGPHAEQMIGSLHVHHCFMSTVGLDPDFGITTLDIMEAQLNQRMIKAASEVTVLADSSKLGHRSLSLIATLSSVHRVITDPGAPADVIQKMREHGVEVMVS